jgi:hypothetical protein
MAGLYQGARNIAIDLNNVAGKKEDLVCQKGKKGLGRS